MPVASKAVPSVIASSVCWSLQCLVSALTQRGRWRTLFFFKIFLLVASAGAFAFLVLLLLTSEPSSNSKGSLGHPFLPLPVPCPMGVPVTSLGLE